MQEEKGVLGKSTTDLASICQKSEGESDCRCFTQDHLSDLTSSLFFEGEETALVEGEPKREGRGSVSERDVHQKVKKNFGGLLRGENGDIIRKQGREE